MMMKKFVSKSVRQDTMRPMEFGKKSKQRTRKFAIERAPSVVFCRSPSGFPDHYHAVLVSASTNQALGIGSTASNGKTLSMNGMSTFNVLGQVALTSVYDSYIVHKASAYIQFFNLSTTVPCRVLVVPVDADLITSLPLATDDALVDLKFAKVNILSVLGGGHDTVSISNTVNISDLLGIKPLTAQCSTATGFTGSPNSSTAYSQPLDKFEFYVSAQTANGANLASNAVYFSFKLTQEIEFFNRLPKGY